METERVGEWQRWREGEGGHPFNGAADILAALYSAARSVSVRLRVRLLAFARSFGGDNVPFHDFTTFVTRHLAPTSLARTDGYELLRDRSSGPRRVVRVPAGSLSVASVPPSTPPSGQHILAKCTGSD